MLFKRYKGRQHLCRVRCSIRPVIVCYLLGDGRIASDTAADNAHLPAVGGGPMTLLWNGIAAATAGSYGAPAVHLMVVISNPATWRL